MLKWVSHEVSLEDQKSLLPATPAPNALPPPPSTEYSPYLSAPGGSVSLNFASSAAQGLSPYDYWGAGASLGGGPSPGGPFVPGGGPAFGQDLNTAFFETLASEDWTGFNGSDGSGDANGLLGQMAATW